MEARSQPPAPPLVVVVVGAGLMGAQIGFEYAMGGHAVVLHARDGGAVRERLDAARATACEAGLGGPEETAAADARIRVTTDLGDIDRADLVVESLPEDADLKEAVLAPLASSARPSPRTPPRCRSASSADGSVRRTGRSERTTGTRRS